ncbi:MAG: NADH-quinone oxidoreductase subunit NuoE [Peptococcaceae bacterium]|jgi:NADH:ubiquinone oxidoreductase subunit E|nr:NADH-quinone oxidoreductase subunit NuoE [Peptococcaceae bacterium]MDR2736785.1 NADH-quinone oxidoreductase subunit NuoE [Gracilibacteraceae bacterium]
MPYEIDIDPAWGAAIDRIIAAGAPEQGLLNENCLQRSSSLIQILEQTQKEIGYLPENVQAYLANKLHIPLSEIYGVTTFYALFNTEPVGKHTISVCMGTACYVKGAGEIVAEFERRLNIEAGQTTLDGLFTLEPCRCLGACGLAPVLTIGDQVYGRLTPADVPDLIEKYYLPTKGEST